MKPDIHPLNFKIKLLLGKGKLSLLYLNIIGLCLSLADIMVSLYYRSPGQDSIVYTTELQLKIIFKILFLQNSFIYLGTLTALKYTCMIHRTSCLRG